MKFRGQPIEKPKPRVIPIVREPETDGEGQIIDKNIYFVADVITDFSDFEKLCPPPEIPFVRKPNEPAYQDPENPQYKALVEVHNQRRLQWMFLKSIERSDGIEWETVSLSQPDTWSNYLKELRDAGFNQVEIGMLQKEVWEHNSINPEKIEEARRSFLATAAGRALK